MTMKMMDFGNQVLNAASFNPDASVLITLHENSIGARASCGITGGHLGIDWETNQFRIEPEIFLVKDTLTRDMPKNKIKWRNVIYCPQCETKIMFSDKYCRKCGQALGEIMNVDREK